VPLGQNRHTRAPVDERILMRRGSDQAVRVSARYIRRVGGSRGTGESYTAIARCPRSADHASLHIVMMMTMMMMASGVYVGSWSMTVRSICPMPGTVRWTYDRGERGPTLL
jgi:hypothetical protein